SGASAQDPKGAVKRPDSRTELPCRSQKIKPTRKCCSAYLIAPERPEKWASCPSLDRLPLAETPQAIQITCPMRFEQVGLLQAGKDTRWIEGALNRNVFREPRDF